MFGWLIAVWLWLTVLFANLAEAVAEGRGKAQAASLRKAQHDDRRPPARRPGGARRRRCSPATHVVVVAGERIPGDGDVVEGVASVDESAITGESAPVIRESGGDRSAVTGGTTVLSDRIVVRITQQARPVLRRPDDRPRRGLRAAADPQRDRAQRPAHRADDRLPARRGHAAAVATTAAPAGDRRARSRCSSA